MKKLFLNTGDGNKIAINHLDSGNTDSVIILCPGLYMTKDAKTFLSLADNLFSTLDVITMDFRGHGKSSGLFTFTAQEPDDIKYVVDYAKQKYQKIAIIGFSLGAASSLIYTSKYKDINSLISVSPPADFWKIENHFLKKESLLPYFEKYEFGIPHFLLLRPGNVFAHKTRPIDIVDEISPIPVLFFAGELDPIVYPWHTKELYNKAKEPKCFEFFDKGLHAEELYIRSKERFMKCCVDWLEETLNINEVNIT